MKFTYREVKAKANPICSWHNYVTHPLTDFVTYLLANYTEVSPNTITALSFIISVFSGLFFLMGNFIAGAILWQISFFCDFIDGTLARLNNKVSSYGAFFDVVTDAFTMFWIPLCIAFSILFSTIQVYLDKRYTFIIISIFIFLQSIPITITFLKDKLITARLNNRRIEDWLDRETSLNFLRAKSVISKYLNRADARVIAFFIGPILGFTLQGFIVADIVLLLHLIIILIGTVVMLLRIDREGGSILGVSVESSVKDYYAFSNNISVSVIIPSLDGLRGGNVPKLIQDLEKQTFKDFELLVIKNTSPQGKAINMGADVAKGEILIIADDDARIDNPDVIGNLVEVLKVNKDVGMAGASILVSPDANWLQRRAGREFPRFGMKVVDRVTESDMACHGCCAIPKRVFEEVGGERENILRGLDPDLRFRLRQKGYKTVLAPNTWVYHPLPATLGKFIKTFFRNGMGSAYCYKYQPHLIYDTDEMLEMKSFNPRVPFLLRIFRFPARIIKAVIEFKFLRVLAYIVYGMGFYYGVLKYSLVGKNYGLKNIA